MKTTDSQGDYQIVVDPMNTAGEQEEDRQFFMEQLRNDRERFGEELDEWCAARPSALS